MKKKEYSLKTSDIAKTFGVTQMTVINWIKIGLPFINVSAGTKKNNYRFNEQDVENWFDNRQKQVE